MNYLADDNSILEGIPLERLVQDNQLSGFIHNGFWQPMDTMRDKMTLESIWQSGNAPWKR